MIRRYTVLLAFALWMGGFTFYALIVIPTGAKVLGGEREVGFITQQVTNWLNALGVLTLLILAWNMFAEGNGVARRWLALAWTGMTVSQVGLFLLHPVIDRMLDRANLKIHDLGHFYYWHRAYLLTVTVQWLAALLYLWVALLIWREADRQKS
ncbi:MAG: hypothetical protein JWR26_3295 [Pedosphaera sp.]|nr:hypothetical protein [Pedosphaera sp.]